MSEKVEAEGMEGSQPRELSRMASELEPENQVKERG